MKTFAIATVLALSTLTTAAQTDGPTFVRGQFAARVERGQPVGDEAAVASAFPLVYWVEMRNLGPSAPVTLVWSYDGRQVARQSLDVGHGSRWRTWGFLPRRAAGHTIEVTLLDAAGATLHTDRVEAH